MVRFKNRYLLFEIVWKDGKAVDAINEASLLSIFRDAVAVNFGDYGVATSAMSLSVKYYNPVTHLCMVRCGTEQFRQVWCALTMNADLSNRRAMMHFLHLGGTLKSCQKAAAKYNACILKDVHLSSQQKQTVQQAEAKLQGLDL